MNLSNIQFILNNVDSQTCLLCRITGDVHHIICKHRDIENKWTCKGCVSITHNLVSSMKQIYKKVK